MTTIAEEDEAQQLAPVDFQSLLADVTFGDAHLSQTQHQQTQCSLHPVEQ